MKFHYIKTIAAPAEKTACSLATWEAGAGTTNRDRVTCADCLALLKPVAPVIAPEPMAHVQHQPKATPAKAMRKGGGNLPPSPKAQDGFNFGGVL